MSSLTAVPPVLDWSQTSLPEYSRHYTKVIDGLFSAEECAHLLALATSTPPNVDDPNSPLGKLQEQHATKPNPQTGNVEWQPVHYGPGTGRNSVRNSDRILRFDQQVAGKIYEKLRPVVPELWEINRQNGKWWNIVGNGRPHDSSVWKLVGYVALNFLFNGGHSDKPPE